MWHRKAWWAGVSSGSLATCPKSELWRQMTGDRDSREQLANAGLRGRWPLCMWLSVFIVVVVDMIIICNIIIIIIIIIYV